jgi:hypothetical protein
MSTKPFNLILIQLSGTVQYGNICTEAVTQLAILGSIRFEFFLKVADDISEDVAGEHFHEILVGIFVLGFLELFLNLVMIMRAALLEYTCNMCCR